MIIYLQTTHTTVVCRRRSEIFNLFKSGGLSWVSRSIFEHIPVLQTGIPHFGSTACILLSNDGSRHEEQVWSSALIRTIEVLSWPIFYIDSISKKGRLEIPTITVLLLVKFSDFLNLLQHSTATYTLNKQDANFGLKKTKVT